jgi:hypothetical protein
MMGRQTVMEPLFHIFCLEDHVPADHPLRQVDMLLDLRFVREAPCCTELREWMLSPDRVVAHPTRTDFGHPSSSIRFKARTAMPTSVA